MRDDAVELRPQTAYVRFAQALNPLGVLVPFALSSDPRRLVRRSAWNYRVFVILTYGFHRIFRRALRVFGDSFWISTGFVSFGVRRIG